MRWLALSYSLPSKSQSTQRVAFWRRLRRLGAVSLAGGLYLLPDRPECLEAFQWLVQEIQQSQGEAFACTIDRLEGIGEQQLVELFNAARRAEYEEFATQLTELETSCSSLALNERQQFREKMNRFRRQYAQIVHIDYFHSPARKAVHEQLDRLDLLFSPMTTAANEVDKLSVTDYVGKRWVTRPRPHVDRMACAWFIRRFIDAQADIRYADTPTAGEVAFDMLAAEFGHRGKLCTFEVMVQSFQLDEPALHKLGEIVHEIDLRDGRVIHAETAGIDVLLHGWLLAEMSDQELERHGITLFEGLYTSFVAAM